MEKMKSIEKFVNEYVDKLSETETFQAREIANAFCDYAAKFGEMRLPYSDTIQRVLRARRSKQNDVNYFSISKSIWWKNDHIATEEERKDYKDKLW